VASLSQGRTAAAQCGLFTHKSVPVIFEPPCTYWCMGSYSSNLRKLQTYKKLIHSTHVFTFSQNWNPIDRHQIVTGVNISRNSVLSTTCTIINLSSKTQLNTDKINIYVYRNQKLHCIKQTKTQSKLGVQGINYKRIKITLT